MGKDFKERIFNKESAVGLVVVLIGCVMLWFGKVDAQTFIIFLGIALPFFVYKKESKKEEKTEFESEEDKK